MKLISIIPFFILVISCGTNQQKGISTSSKVDSSICVTEPLEFGFNKAKVLYIPELKNIPSIFLDTNLVFTCYDSIGESHEWPDINFKEIKKCDCNEEIYRRIYDKSYNQYFFRKIRTDKKAELNRIKKSDFLYKEIANTKEEMFRFNFDSIAHIDSNYVEDITSKNMELTVIKKFTITKLKR